MSELNASIRQDILHIPPRAAHHVSADSVDAILTSLSHSVVTCPDVYRALARLYDRTSERFCGVVVCVDELGLDELEFFTLACRVNRGLTVLVYGHEQSESWIERAIESGATGRATRESIQSLVTHAKTSPGAVAPTEPSEPCDPDGALQHAPSAPVARQDPQEDQAESEATARVPWLRYDDRPARHGPGDAQPAPSLDASALPDAPGPHDPLLSKDELNALIGDFEPGSGTPEEDPSAPSLGDEEPAP